MLATVERDCEIRRYRAFGQFRTSIFGRRKLYLLAVLVQDNSAGQIFRREIMAQFCRLQGGAASQAENHNERDG
jgi:hypothetical protein